MDSNHQKNCVQIFRNKYHVGMVMMMQIFTTVHLLMAPPINHTKDTVALAQLVIVRNTMTQPLHQGLG